MKKLIGLVLTMVMVVSLVACGGNSTEDNNASVQAKIDTLQATYDEIYAFYEDNGYLVDGVPEGLQALTDGHNETLATHESYLVEGYSDEQAEAMNTLLDEQIVIYNDSLAGMKATVEE